MNKIINNLALITDCCEYHDKATSAAWKLRACLTNMFVWAANSYLYAVKTDSIAQRSAATIKLATLRTWMRDVNSTGFNLDLLPAAIAKTLGLEREVDIHEEAKRSARQKCMMSRSPANFKKFYQAAIDKFEQQRTERQAAVSQIADLLSDSQVFVDHTLADHWEYRDIASFQPNEFVEDIDLYDEASVETENDKLAECLGNILEALDQINTAVLANTIIESKAAKLSGFTLGISSMMDIVGVDKSRLAARQERLDAQLKAAEKAIDAEAKSMDEVIEAQLAEIQQPLVNHSAAKVTTIKSDARLARERAEAIDAEAKAEYKKAQAKAKRAAKRGSKTLAEQLVEQGATLVPLG